MNLPADSVIGANDGHAERRRLHRDLLLCEHPASRSRPPARRWDRSLPFPATSTWSSSSTRRSIPTRSARATSRSARERSPARFRSRPQAVDLTITGVTQDGTLTLTIPAGALVDQYGVPSLGFTGTYVTDIVSEPYPTPLVGQPPAGSLIYDPSVTGTVGFVGDTDTYTLALAAGQTALARADDRLRPDRHGHSGGPRRHHHRQRDRAAARGPPSCSSPLRSATAGTYSLIVGGSGGTTGSLHAPGDLERGLQAVRP